MPGSEMPSCTGFVHYVVTDFGHVQISASTLAWLNSVDPEWWKIVNNKRKRGKHARYVREQFALYQAAVDAMALLAFAKDEQLKEL